ncbi:DUF2249 domain-containing protein [Streptomyces sp. bgisy154]|uniref:DUF2249 domain-containing protein n=1 Tax=Streptomyces sp. bgisy154 TaxID=3413794 RepID=UPI003D7488CB
MRHLDTRGGCGAACDRGGGADEEAGPEPDVGEVAHARRHAAVVVGALDAVQAGRPMALIAPHDPTPLLAQVEDRRPDAFAVEDLQRGPET